MVEKKATIEELVEVGKNFEKKGIEVRISKGGLYISRPSPLEGLEVII